jgi:hypothetical protein
MATSAVTSDKQQQIAQNILENALLLIVTRTWPPTFRTIKSPILQTTADRKMISSNKKLWDSKELKAIVANEVKLDEYLKRKATPVPLKKGNHLLAEDLFHEVENEFMAHVERRNQLIDAFEAVYEQAKLDAQNLLGDQYNPNDYPSKERIRSYFHFSWEYLQFGVSERLKQLNKEVAERKHQEFQAQIIQAGEAANQLLEKQAQTIFTHLLDRLTPAEDPETGEMKRKIFRDKMLSPVNDFILNFSARNLGQHEGLSKLVDQVKGLMDGVTVQQLKDNDQKRIDLESKIREVKDNLDKMIISEPSRRIMLADEEI